MGTQQKIPDECCFRLKRVMWYLLLGLGFLPVSLPAWSSEAAVRVAFVYNFIKFIEWPVAPSGQTFHLCVLDAVGETRTALDQLKGMSANKKTIDLLYFTDKAAISSSVASCQMVYRPARPVLIPLPHPLPTGVVLVADEPSAEDSDVSIGVVKLADDRIKFVINQSAIDRAGVKVSSQLLKLGTVIREGKD